MFVCALYVNHMVEYLDDIKLSMVFKALSDITRRSLLRQLCQHGASPVTSLAEHYEMSLNAISKHIKVLEKAGLVRRRTIGRVHLIEADLEQISLAEQWFHELKSIWSLRLAKLDEILSGGTEND